MAKVVEDLLGVMSMLMLLFEDKMVLIGEVVGVFVIGFDNVLMGEG